MMKWLFVTCSSLSLSIAGAHGASDPSQAIYVPYTAVLGSCPVGYNLYNAGGHVSCQSGGANGTIGIGIDVTSPTIGATCNGTGSTDGALINAYLAGEGATTHIPAVVPTTAVCEAPTGIQVPGGASLIGQGPILPSSPFEGATIQCPASLAGACVKVGQASPLLSGNVSNIISSFTGTPVSGDIGFNFQGYNPGCSNLGVSNAYDAYTWSSGIHANCGYIYDTAISHNHLNDVGYPELYVFECRMGKNGNGDVNSNAYLGVTGTDPNTINIIGCQFNSGGTAKATYGMDFEACTQINGIYTFDSDYFEGITTALFNNTDGACSPFFRTKMVNTVVNSTGATFGSWASGTAGIIQTMLTSDTFFIHDFTLPSGKEIAIMQMSDILISGTTDIEGAVGSRLEISNLYSVGNLTIGPGGVGGWTNLTLDSLFTGATYTDNGQGTILATNVPIQTISPAPTVAFSGTSTGFTAVGSGTAQRQPTGRVEYTVAVTFSAVVSLPTGQLQLTGLPFTCESTSRESYWPALAYATGLQSMTGPAIAYTHQGSTTIDFGQSGATGTTALTNSNVTSSTSLGATVSCIPN